MVGAENEIVARVKIGHVVIRSVVFEQDSVAVRRCLRLFVFVKVVVHISFIGGFEINFGLKVARVLRHVILENSLTVGEIMGHLPSFPGFCQLVILIQQLVGQINLLSMYHILVS